MSVGSQALQRIEESKMIYQLEQAGSASVASVKHASFAVYQIEHAEEGLHAWERKPDQRKDMYNL